MGLRERVSPFESSSRARALWEGISIRDPLWISFRWGFMPTRHFGGGSLLKKMVQPLQEPYKKVKVVCASKTLMHTHEHMSISSERSSTYQHLRTPTNT